MLHTGVAAEKDLDEDWPHKEHLERVVSWQSRIHGAISKRQDVASNTSAFSETYNIKNEKKFERIDECA